MDPNPPKIIRFPPSTRTPEERYGRCPDCGDPQGPVKKFSGVINHPFGPCGRDLDAEEKELDEWFDRRFKKK